MLTCGACRIRVPVIEGFPLFTERAPDDGSPPAGFLERTAVRAGLGMGTPGEFHSFCEGKRRRGIVDAYAAWAPFNESGRTPLSFVPLLRDFLRPGDTILDLSSRSGWTGEFLAGLFPEQLVISAWEGNRDTLGYRGYREWLPRRGRAPNLEILFFDPREPLPLAAGAVRFVHAYDLLHDLGLETALPEILRVATPDAVLLFPHVHLRGQPHEPAFERHGTLRTRAEYREAFGKGLRGSGRRACLMGEATFFLRQKSGDVFPLCDEPESADYNAVLAAVPEAWVGRPLRLPGPPPDLAAASVLVNPLFEVSPSDGAVSVTGSEGMSEMPGRHPVYAGLIPSVLQPPLDPRERLVLYWAKRLATIAGIAVRMKETPGSLAPLLAQLERRELVRVVALSRAGYRLQRFHALLEDAPLADEDDLPGVWRLAVERWRDRPFLLDHGDGGRLTYGEADRVVGAICRRLRSAGVRAGDRVALCAPQHIEGLLLFWAAAHLGAPLAVIDVALPPAEIAARLRGLRPVLLFASSSLHASLPGGPPCPTVLLDPLEDELAVPGTDSPPTLMAWLRDEDYAGGLPPAGASLADSPGAILYTSGTTGGARGVVLTQRALAHSGRLMARMYGWRPEDVHICPSDLHTVGSLRSPGIATVHAGASTVVASPSVRSNTTRLAACIDQHRVTLLNATPALLRLFTAWSDRLPAGSLSTLRSVLAAGSALTAGVREAFEGRYGVPVRNLYGLTETSGLSVAEPPGGSGPSADAGDIGIPIDAEVRIVDDSGRDVPTGSPGELWIHNANLFTEYAGDPETTSAAFAGPWFRTRDRARVDAGGRVSLVGRTRDAIKNAHSEFVTVQEVQEALDGLPELADSGVGAWVDGFGQDHLGAVVVPREPVRGEAAVGEFLSRLRLRLQEVLGTRRMPTRIVVRESVPRNSNGKVPSGPGLERILDHE